MNIGLIGCGNISGIYLKNSKLFPGISLKKCADQRKEAAEARAAEFGIEAVGVEELLNDPEIDIILNLTTPLAHTEIDLRALAAGKHVYSEKPFAVSVEDGRKVLALAESRNLRVGCAPDTFLGGGQQCCRSLLDKGTIGRVVAGTAFMMNHGHEAWHPAPGFYYQKGGGPLFDMGPYYLTSLVNLLGPIRRVSAFNTRSTDLRQGLGATAGKTFPVEVDTHVAGLLEFVSGAVITLVMSFDVWAHGGYRDIELYGSEGTIRVPDPNLFSEEVRFFRAGVIENWAVATQNFAYKENMRILGLAEMAEAIRQGRPHRCSGELAFHVLEAMCALVESGRTGASITLKSSCERPAAFREGMMPGELN